MSKIESLQAALAEHLADYDCQWQAARGEITLEINATDQFKTIMRILRDGKGLQFEQCIDVCGVDYAAYGHSEWQSDAANTGFSRAGDRQALTQLDPKSRFAVVYHLLSVSLNQRIRVRIYLDADFPAVDSVVDLWNGANWFEREAFDLYGILFHDHPDLRRILTDYGFVGHPFRKDFPLVGQVEMRYDPEKGRVVYEPVSIEQRTVVPRVVRHDARYEQETE